LSVESRKRIATFFVERLGLKPLFALFMGSCQFRTRKISDSFSGLKRKDLAACEEMLLSLTQSIARHCTGNSLARVLNKFVECSFEKLQRLFEIHSSAQERIRIADEERREAIIYLVDEADKEAETSAEKQGLPSDLDSRARQREIQVEEEMRSQRVYLQRCEDGLGSLQQCDLLILRLANAGNRQLQGAVQSLFAIKGVDKHEVLENILEYQEQLDGTSKKDERDELDKFIQILGTPRTS